MTADLPRLLTLSLLALLSACGSLPQESGPAPVEAEVEKAARVHLLEKVDDTGVIQLYADGFEALSLQEKLLCYHLSQAAIAGRDIFIDQKFAHSLRIRDLLEELYLRRQHMPAEVGAEIERYTKLFWLNNGIHDHLSTKKRLLELSLEQYTAALRVARRHGARLPGLHETAELYGILTNPKSYVSCTNKSPADGGDPVAESCNNLYVGVSMAELQERKFKDRFPLNSRLVKRGGNFVEEVYRIGDPAQGIPPGLYAEELSAVCAHLQAAIPYAPEKTQIALRALIKYYHTGLPADWRAYNIAWVQDNDSSIDTINGFIEVYLDARGMKGAWEAVVSFVNPAKAEGMKRLAREAQWFEDRMPWEDRFKKKEVKGIIANAITVVMETGDSGPMTPIGINLPNEAEIRQQFGSKSVNLANVVEGYNEASSGGSVAEFAWDEAEVQRARKYGALTSNVHTDLHEVVGHASGQIMPEIINPAQILGRYYSTLEEGRADLVGLYWIADKKLQEMGIVPDDAAALAEYEAYARNALVQLRRVEKGGKLEEDHMRNRQLVVHWLIDKTPAIQVVKREGKTYYRVSSIAAFRKGCGELLAELMRIKATGDFKAGKALVEQYGTRVDPTLHEEVLERMAALGLSSSSGFVQPRLELVRGGDGEPSDVRISYPMSLEAQMLRWSGRKP